MSIVFLTLATVSTLLLILVQAIQLRPSGYSRFELERRAKDDPTVRQVMKRDARLPDIQTLLNLKVLLLLVVTTIFTLLAFGWGWGIAVALTVATFFQPLARWRLSRRLGSALYNSLEPTIVRYLPKLRRLIRLVRQEAIASSKRFHSREELQHMVAQSGDILSHDEQTMVQAMLSFDDKRVKSVMTPKHKIVSIHKNEFLGPLVLSELHDTGHSRLPVIRGDINHVVGVLYLRDLLSLDVKRSVTAEKAMDPKVFYIPQDATLAHTLALFLKTHHHLFIVVDNEQKTVGLVTIEDVIEALLGRKLVVSDENQSDTASL